MRIVVFAYACEPGRGSEPAAGWWWAQILAHLGETWIITRANNRAVIESELETNGPLSNVHFVYVDLPPNLRRWKRGQRGVRLYYLLWQYAALREARRRAREQPFDLAWHLTLANAWLGSSVCLLGIPFIYGPVGAGVRTSWRLAGTLGAKGILYDLVRDAARMLGRYFNPLARASWRRASLILVQNEETKRWLPRRHQVKAEVFPHVVLERPPTKTIHGARQVMLFAGRLLPLKGVSLAIRALEGLPKWRLIVCGDGPDSVRLRRLAKDRGVEDRVDFRGWVERGEVLRTMREEASVFVFPSLHDQSPFVVVEAMASGLPVVCLDIGGPPIIAGSGTAVAPAGTRVTAERIAQRVLEATEADPDSIRIRASEFLLEERLARLQNLLQARRLLDAFQPVQGRRFEQVSAVAAGLEVRRPSGRVGLESALPEPTRSPKGRMVVDKKADAIVVAYQSADVIVDCIFALHSDPAVDRILVVNNSPGDGTAGAVEDMPYVTYLEPGENIGFGRAVNLVRDQMRNDYIVLANPDTTQSGQTVSKAIDFLEERARAAVIGPRMISPDGTLYRNSQHSVSIVRMAAERIRWPERLRVSRSLSEHQTAHLTDYVIGSFLICRRTALDAVEWFDDSIFLFGEDQDICRRLRSAGWEVWYAPLGAVVHESGHSWRQLDDEGRDWFRRARRREVKAESGLVAVAIYSVLEKLSRSSRR